MYVASAFAFTPAAIISEANVCRHADEVLDLAFHHVVEQGAGSGAYEAEARPPPPLPDG